MIEISLEEVNRRSPYTLSVTDNDSLEFTTDNGKKYQIGFVKDEAFEIDGFYQFFIKSMNEIQEARDPKVQITIQEVLVQFFYENNVAVSYVCDVSDSRQAVRNRLFRKWFYAFSRNEDYQYRTISIEFEGIEYFASFIFKKSDSLSLVYSQSIDSFEYMMRAKLR